MKLLYKVLLNFIVMSATESESKKPPAEKVAEVFNHMQDVGCCEMCAHLYSGKSQDSFYERLHKEHIKNGTDVKKPKNNPCISCLGLLHSPFRENITDKIISEILASENDYDSFNLAMTLPISYQMRAHALAYYVKKNYPEVAHTHNNIFPWVNIKDVYKATMAPTIAKTVKRMLKFNSELTINVKLTYSNDELECFKLLELCPDVFGQRNTKKFRGFLFSKKSVDEALNNKKNVKLRNFYINPPSIPNHELLCSEVDIKQNQIYCAGRYNKYSRSLPQSPWIKNNQRRFNSSVQELIAKDVQNLFKADDYLFSSSGREDVDVRMLGTGRPFSIELINPKCTKVTQKQIDSLMDKINNENGEKIRVQDMTTVSKDHLKLLKDGEDSKTKTYEALCVSKNPLTMEHLLNISKCTPLVVNQKTPIRVLHRRANLVRLKTIHSMDATIIPHSRNDNQTFFCLKLVTQAGTYVKEFVNGDFGRTLPNLGTLLNDPDIDILALDVLNIDLDWPPKKKTYKFVTQN
ncbi:hypothetical protein M8J77_014090 [Diaphorina citri]|nr:hypothetical protein M8J77_014090 [Diaphorina citri]